MKSSMAREQPLAVKEFSLFPHGLKSPFVPSGQTNFHLFEAGKINDIPSHILTS